MQVVLLIDGAEGLANMGRLCFPNAIQIVDFYHALEHAGRVLVALLGNKEHPEYKPRLGRWAKRLLNDKVQQLIAQTRQECAGKLHVHLLADDRPTQTVESGRDRRDAQAATSPNQRSKPLIFCHACFECRDFVVEPKHAQRRIVQQRRTFAIHFLDAVRFDPRTFAFE